MTEQEFWDILFDVPASVPVFFRLYHDDKGHPLFYSMEDLPGTYIEIDADTYARSAMLVRVRNGKIVQIRHRAAAKLTPGRTGTACHAQDVAVIADSDNSTKWAKKIHEQN